MKHLNKTELKVINELFNQIRDNRDLNSFEERIYEKVNQLLISDEEKSVLFKVEDYAQVFDIEDKIPYNSENEEKCFNQVMREYWLTDKNAINHSISKWVIILNNTTILMEQLTTVCGLCRGFRYGRDIHKYFLSSKLNQDHSVCVFCPLFKLANNHCCIFIGGKLFSINKMFASLIGEINSLLRDLRKIEHDYYSIKNKTPFSHTFDNY